MTKFKGPAGENQFQPPDEDSHRFVSRVLSILIKLIGFESGLDLCFLNVCVERMTFMF